MTPTMIPGVAVNHDPVNGETRPYVCPVETARGQFITARRNIDAARTWSRLLILTGRAEAAGLTGQHTWWRRQQQAAWERCLDALAHRDEWRTEP